MARVPSGGGRATLPASANHGTKAWGMALTRRASDGAYRSLSFTLLTAAAPFAPACINPPGACIPRLSF